MACCSSSDSLCTRTWNCSNPLAALSVAVTVANGNATRSAVNKANMDVELKSGDGLIFTSVASWLFVTATIFAPLSMRLATDSKLADWACAGPRAAEPFAPLRSDGGGEADRLCSFSSDMNDFDMPTTANWLSRETPF